MKRYTVSWRMALDAAADPKVFEELLDRLTAETSVADELWIILSEPTSYCYEPLESIAEKCERFRIPAAAARARGVRVGINPWPTFGTDEPYYADNGRPPMPFQSMVGCDGVKSIGTACPVSPEFLAYTRARYKLFAKAGASFVWVDDDCRLTHLGGTSYPCFCPNCVRHFDGGRFADRETLVAALNRPENRALRRKWSAYGAERLATYCRAVREAVDEVDPSIDTPFMSVGFSHTTFSGDYIERCMEALRAKAARPGHGFYWDDAPMGMFEKAMDMSRQISRMPESVLSHVHYEEESCPGTLLNKAADTRLMEMALSIWGGCTGVAMNHLVSAGGGHPFDFLKYEAAQLKANRDFFDRYLTFVDGLPQRGVWAAFSEWAAADMKVGERGWFHEDDPDYSANRCVAEWPNFGLPITADPRGAYAALLQGRTAELFSDEELDEMLRKPLFVDGLALQVLWERGFGERCGVRIKEVSHSGSEKLAPSAYDGGFAGAERGGIFGPYYNLEPLSDEVETLSLRARPYGIPDEICAAKYHNVVALGYAPYRFTGTPGRLHMMREVQKALGAPVLLHPSDEYDPPRVSVWVRADENRAAVLLINAETGPARPFEVMFRGAAAKAVSMGLNRADMALETRRDGEYVYARVPGMQPWEMAVVLFE